jgi:hypothetical protein
MATLHNVTITTKGMRGYFETLALIKAFRAVLETAAKETDKSAGAHSAIAATVTFLIANKTPRHLLAPLVHAAEIIQRDMGVKAMSLERAGDVFDAIAVDLQRRCGVTLEGALRNIVGNDPAAAQHLRDFRKNIMSKKSVPKGARDFYNLTMRDHYTGLPPDKAMKKALAVCNARRGQKV